MVGRGLSFHRDLQNVSNIQRAAGMSAWGTPGGTIYSWVVTTKLGGLVTFGIVTTYLVGTIYSWVITTKLGGLLTFWIVPTYPGGDYLHLG